MEYAIVTISGSRANAKLHAPIVAGTVGGTVSFQFDESWDGYQKTLVWRGSGVTVDDTGCTGIIPAEVVAAPGRLFVGVYGTKDNAATPTTWADLGNIMPGADPSGDPTTDPTLPVWAQIMQKKHIDDAAIATDSTWSSENILNNFAIPFSVTDDYATPIKGSPIQVVVYADPVGNGTPDSPVCRWYEGGELHFDDGSIGSSSMQRRNGEEVGHWDANEGIWTKTHGTIFLTGDEDWVLDTDGSVYCDSIMNNNVYRGSYTTYRLYGACSHAPSYGSYINTNYIRRASDSGGIRFVNLVDNWGLEEASVEALKEFLRVANEDVFTRFHIDYQYATPETYNVTKIDNYVGDGGELTWTAYNDGGSDQNLRCTVTGFESPDAAINRLKSAIISLGGNV